MSRARPMSPAERAAMADALRHMRKARIPNADLARIAGGRMRAAYPRPKREARP